MINVENLSFQYPKTTVKAIRDLRFDIDRGEVFGFLGPSGSGKSTTQKILFNMLKNYEGQAKIEGKEINKWDRSLFHKIGVGFELPNHYLKLTCIENLNFFASFYNNCIDPVLLLNRIGLGDAIHKKVGDCSKGMKMRLNFVRAIMHQPDILFLDEPTSGLDPSNARLIKNWIQELKQEGKTIFITTHQMHDADELCDRVAFLADGEIKALGSPSELKRKYAKNTLELSLENGSKHQFELKNLGANQDFLNLIASNNIASIHSGEANLDDVFIAVTGKSLI